MSRERAAFEAEEQKRHILARFGFVCRYPGCTSPAIFLAHRIAQGKNNMRKYGRLVLHHPDNLVPVCSDQKHNDFFNCGNDPEATRELVRAIREKL